MQPDRLQPPAELSQTVAAGAVMRSMAADMAPTDGSWGVPRGEGRAAELSGKGALLGRVPPKSPRGAVAPYVRTL